jgi:diaminopimelate epimerase
MVTVHMPGGSIKIEISPNYDIRMTGPVTRIADGQVYEEIFDFNRLRKNGFVARNSRFR